MDSYSFGVRTFREALNWLGSEVFNLSAICKSMGGKIIVKIAGVITLCLSFGFGFYSLFIAIFKYHRSLTDALLYSLHGFLFTPIMVLSLWLFAMCFCVFHIIREGIFNQLSDRWLKNAMKKLPGKTSFITPYYRFMIPSGTIAFLFAIMPFIVIQLIRFACSMLVPDGMPSPFSMSDD